MGNLCGVTLSVTEMQSYMAHTHRNFSQEEITNMYKVFMKAAPAGAMDFNHFKHYLELVAAQSATLGQKDRVDADVNAEQLFRGYDRARRGSVTFLEFLEFQEAMIYNTDRLIDIIFAMYDENQDGYLEKRELLNVVSNSTLNQADADIDTQELIVLLEVEIDKLWRFLDPGDIHTRGIPLPTLRRANEVCPGLIQGLKGLA
eukprot:Hpha_TRINITY_DN17682_c0_g1::TRINITY_DN17682_c0_g1_i1::g.158735::m.158735